MHYSLIARICWPILGLCSCCEVSEEEKKEKKLKKKKKAASYLHNAPSRGSLARHKKAI